MRKIKKGVVLLLAVVLILQLSILGVYAEVDCNLERFVDNTTKEDLINNFNVLVFSDIVLSNSDIEGRAAISGDLEVSNYSFGTKLTTSKSRGDLIVGGDISAENGQVFVGTTVIGEKSNVKKYSLNNPNGYKTDKKGYVKVKQNDVDEFFKNAKEDMYKYSDELCSYESNSKAKVENNSLKIKGENTDLNVFEIDGNNLCGKGISIDKVSRIEIDVPKDSVCLINVTGKNIGLTNCDMNLKGTKEENVMWNFNNVEKAHMGSISVKGSILSPKTEWQIKGSGNVDGTMVAAKINCENRNFTEFHNKPFKGKDKLKKHGKRKNNCKKSPEVTETTAPDVVASETPSADVSPSETVSPVETDNNETPNVENTPDVVNSENVPEATNSENAAVEKDNNIDDSKLPQTGEESSNKFIIIGIIIVIAGIGVFVFKKIKS